MTSEAPTNVAASEDQIVKHLDIGTEARDKLLPTLYGHILASIRRFCLAPMTVRLVSIYKQIWNRSSRECWL